MNEQYSMSEVKAAAERAGFSGRSLILALAIAQLESGFRNVPGKANPNDRGVWQINRTAHPNVPDSVAYDLNAAAKETYRISKGGTDWTPWTTWKNQGNGSTTLAGAISNVTGQLGISASTGEMLPGFEGAKGEAVGLDGGPIDIVTGPGGLASGVASLIKSPLDFLKVLLDQRLWVRIAQVVGGALILILAFVALFIRTDTAKGVINGKLS